MALFQYTASDADGKSVSGSVTADSPAAARQKLERQGLGDVQLADGEVAAELPDGDLAEAGMGRDSSSRPDSGTAGGAEAISTTVQLIEAGIPLAAGLQAFSEEVRSNSLRISLQEMARRLDGGEGLESVLDSPSLRLPVSLRGLVAAGTRAGNPADFMTHFLRFARLQSRLRDCLRLSLAYPAVLLLVGVLIMWSMLYFVVPQMRVIFEDFELELPILTDCVLEISRLTVIAAGWWPVATVVLTAVILILPAGLRRLNSLVLWRRFVYGLPLLGSTVRYGVLAEYCHLLAILIDYQIPLPEALKLAGDGTADCCLREGSYELSLQVERGEPLLPGQTPGVIPTSILNVISWSDRQSRQGDSTGGALRSAGDMYIAHTEVQSRVLTALLEPVSVLLIAGMVGGLVIALFEPMVALLNQLS